MNLDLILKLVSEGKLDTENPFCDKCYVNLLERTENTENGTRIYQECPTCHKQWVFECDKNGYIVSVKDI